MGKFTKRGRQQSNDFYIFLILNIDIRCLLKLSLHCAARSFKHFPGDRPQFGPVFCNVAESNPKI